MAGYLAKLGSTNQGLYNASGRAFPDVAANSMNFSILDDGDPYISGATSAATPTFASIVALVNDALISAGKPALGFLNPFLYSGGGAAFTDITIGMCFVYSLDVAAVTHNLWIYYPLQVVIRGATLMASPPPLAGMRLQGLAHLIIQPFCRLWVCDTDWFNGVSYYAFGIAVTDLLFIAIACNSRGVLQGIFLS